ncbi:hypothetical protein GCM10011316_34470 [Roseibium aquae]|uniref:Uncharacterized protein n=1 Tax=Roseibium aquae TaxID=1323746 RepID=A0A916X370_9HYPH|nr:hypothetical protein GCM10011316_34470 [Roseibium aquae]
MWTEPVKGQIRRAGPSRFRRGAVALQCAGQLCHIGNRKHAQGRGQEPEMARPYSSRLWDWT